MTIEWIQPDWPAPDNIVAASTTRLGGVSEGVYRALNLGDHVDDRIEHVAENRHRLEKQLALPTQPRWLQQVHGANVQRCEQAPLPSADASFTHTPATICAILTADCLPLLVCNRQGTEVAAIHGGWRSLAQGIIANTVAQFTTAPSDCLVWLGPAIGPNAFEVGQDVVDAFVDYHSAFTARGDKYLANIFALATMQCQALGIEAIYGGEWCTVSDPQRFFSYRRDGQTGRQASLIYMR